MQKFDAEGFENGVFLGPVGSLTVKGPFKMNGVGGLPACISFGPSTPFTCCKVQTSVNPSMHAVLERCLSVCVVQARSSLAPGCSPRVSTTGNALGPK